VVEPQPQIDPNPPSLLARVRSSDVALGGALSCALAILLGVMNWHYEIATWLAWHYFMVATLALLWAVSCLGCGSYLLGKLQARSAGSVREPALAFPLGVLSFQVAIFLLGLAGLLGLVTFFALPVLFAYAGRRELAALARAARDELRPPGSFQQLAILLFGIAGAGILYFQILSPESLHWDARWYHLPIAQQYALQGAVRPSPERWWLAGYPHSGSLIYTWAFMLPGVILFDRLELCLHLEFVVFLATIASIPTLVRHLVGGIKGQGTWAAIFLFPGIFLYDSNLCGAADHLAALWCVPIVLSLLRLWRNWTVREAGLFGLFMGAGLAAKYSVWAMLIFPGLLFLGRAFWLGLLRLGSPAGARRSALLVFLAGMGVMLAVSAQHWLKNWIWYGDPIYPLVHKAFHVQPWSPEADASYRLYTSFAFPPRPGLDGLRDALRATITFAFIPNDWPVFHRNVPVFGFLFSLSILCLPLLRTSVRLWLTYLGVLIAIVFWFLTTHQDRYLQAWLPVMVACTMATLIVAWNRRNLAVRALVGALVAFQVIWGGDVPFFPTHNLTGDSPIRLVSSFLASGFLRNPDRFVLFGDEGRVARRLPPGAVLLVHEGNLQVGFGARTVSDQWQSRLSYATLSSPAAIYRELSDLKVTHLVWQEKSSGWNSIGSDLAFMGFALNYTLDQASIGKSFLARFPTSPPPEGQGNRNGNGFTDKVAIFACGSPYPNGLYRLRSLIVPAPGQAPASPEAPIPDLATAVAQTGFLVVDPACSPTLPAELATRFHPPYSLGGGPLRAYVRRF